MAAQESNENIMCPKCFALLKAGTDFCPECGAAISRGSEGSDTEVYQDLARANLLRMRGNTKDSVDVCLGILRRFPNNVTAHTLLGDIYAEQGDLKQSAEWYEMALDLAPDSDVDRSKLAKVRERMAEKEAASTVQQLGIPDKKDHSKPIAIAMAIGIVVVGAAAFFAGKGMNDPTPRQAARIDAPVTIGNPPSTTSTSVNPGSVSSVVAPDQAALAALQTSARDATKIVAATEDPRGPYVVVTLAAATDDKPVDLVVQMAKDAYSAMPNLRHLTVRIVTAGAVILIADVSRQAHDQAKGTAWDDRTSDQLAPLLLSQVWPANAVPAPPTSDAAPTEPSPTDPTAGRSTQPESQNP